MKAFIRSAHEAYWYAAETIRNSYGVWRWQYTHDERLHCGPQFVDINDAQKVLEEHIEIYSEDYIEYVFVDTFSSRIISIKELKEIKKKNETSNKPLWKEKDNF